MHSPVLAISLDDVVILRGSRLVAQRCKPALLPRKAISSISDRTLHQITHFSDNLVADAWSRDGKLALTRETESSDVVLFSDYH
jgi:hypothetical protein